MAKLMKVRSGSYAGEAIGYVNRSVTISPEATSYTITANIEDPALPPKEGSISVSPDVWRQLAASKEISNVDKLPAVIGKPDASDKGGEWIEFEFEDGVRRIDFESGSTIEAINDVVETVREVRKSVPDEPE